METDVQLTIDGCKAKLSNGILTVEFNENGTVTSLVKNNQELVHNLNGSEKDPDRYHTFYVDYHAERKFRNLTVKTLKVIKNTKDEAHITYVDDTSMLYFEYNIIMKKGDSGLYSYVITKNNLGKEFALSELRTVYRLDSGIFDHAYNAERTGKQPTHSHMSQGKKIQDETYEMSDGELYTNGNVYSKYDYAGYFKDNHFWGQYGHGFGFWFIPVSTEYYPSGPLKQELLVHYDGIILNYMTGAHFGTGEYCVPEKWEKLYGPWYVYVNCGDEQQVIRDAGEKAAIEEQKWPYQWMDEPLYPTARTTVTGKLTVTHNRSSAGAMMVLAKPGSEPIRQKGDYIFSTQADATGTFSIKNVRPGTYTLYAYATQGDITSSFVQDDVVVDTGDLHLGELMWNPPYHAKKLWQIGVADRTATTFKFANELRNYKWQGQVPAQLDFVIGESQDSEDWYYAQTKPGDWNIWFDLPEVTEEKFYLTVAMAGFTKGKMDGEEDPNVTIKVNGSMMKVVSYPSDTSIYRQAMKSGWYHLEKLEIDYRSLKMGKNVITFTNNNSAIMYNTILLESD